MVRLGETRIHLIPHLLTQQAAAGDVHGKSVHRRRQVQRSFLPERVGKPGGFLIHDSRVPAHGRVAQRRIQETQLLRHDLGGHVVGHAAPEDGHRELVHGAGVELVLGRPKVAVVGFRPRKQHELAGAQPEADKFAVLAPAAIEHRHRVFLELRQMAQQRPAAGEFRNRLVRRRRGPRRTQGGRTVGMVCHVCLQYTNGTIEYGTRSR